VEEADINPLPTALVGDGKFFILTAKGDSMTGIGVDDGDLVIVREQNTCRDGDYAVALVNGTLFLGGAVDAAPMGPGNFQKTGGVQKMKFRLKQYADLAEKTKKMTVRELLMAVSCPGVLPGRNIQKGYSMLFLHSGEKEQMTEFVNRYNEGDGTPAMICSDTECGAGSMIHGTTCFPSLMALGKIGDPDLAYRVGRLTAKESLEAGYRWSLSPCVDIVLNDEAPAVSTRAAGEDAETVISVAGAYLRGMQDGGLAATLKHFPGDGATIYDHHITTSVNPLSLEEWHATYGRVYRAMIDQGAACVMPGHISLPCYDTVDEQTGVCPPATLSRRLMTDLLKGELGFEGIVCSDAVVMGGFCGYMNYYKACATFLKCGGDILLFAKTTDLFYEKMETLVQEGFLPLEILRDRAYRCLCFCRQIREEFVPLPALELDPSALAREAVERSISVVRDRAGVLPLSPGSKLLLVDFSNSYGGADGGVSVLYERMQQAGYDVELKKDPGNSFLFRTAEEGTYDAIICTVANRYGYGTNVLRPHGALARNLMGGWTKVGTPCVFLCLHHPYFYKHFPALADTVINTYGVTEETYPAVLKVLFGQ